MDDLIIQEVNNTGLEEQHGLRRHLDTLNEDEKVKTLRVSTSLCTNICTSYPLFSTAVLGQCYRLHPRDCCHKMLHPVSIPQVPRRSSHETPVLDLTCYRISLWHVQRIRQRLRLHACRLLLG